MEDKIFKGLCGLIMVGVAFMGFAMAYDILFNNKSTPPKSVTVEYLGSYEVRKVCNTETNNCVCFSDNKKGFATFKCP